MVDGNSLTMAGQTPDRDPIVQASLAARWLEDNLQESTGGTGQGIALGQGLAAGYATLSAMVLRSSDVVHRISIKCTSRRCRRSI
jgi:hypothetical protein